jgi:phenylpropionate dioxygenase-like ring-hydroxylating dioxygenase large terminal subunit
MRRSDYAPAVRDVIAQIDALDDDAAAAALLPRECYASEPFFAFERDAVFGRSWVCVGRVDQIPNPGDYLAVPVGGEPLLVVRNPHGEIHAMSAVCRHRGQVLTCESGSGRRAFKCPLHFWTYDLDGRLINAPRMGGREAVEELRRTLRLPHVRVELWHGFIFVNLDDEAPALAPSLAKLEPTWAGYEGADLVTVPPVPADKPLPWNWKVQLENFTDAYHPEYVHIGTHDFAPSNHRDGGVAFTDMREGDNAIVRTVPMLKPDGGMMRDGWGENAMFPAIETLSPTQRTRLTFAMVPPNMQLMFAPGVVAYTLINPAGAEATFASSDRVTGGGWVLPRRTTELNDFGERCAAVREGASKIWAQDVPVNLAMQAGKRSRFHPKGCYSPLEKTLQQFNQWLVWRYRAGWAAAAA